MPRTPGVHANTLIAEYARPGEVLMTQGVVDAVDGTPVTFTGIGASS